MAGTISGNSANADTSAKFTRPENALDSAALAQQVRNQLEWNGFTHVSALVRDSSGGFAGTAIKNGKTVMVAVVFPPAPPHQPAID
jgi:CO/xanthine dehydrogenase FAD-binding subunit